MPIRVPTRRSAIRWAAALAVASTAALAQGPAYFRSVAADVRPLRQNVGDPTAAWIGESLPGFLGEAFGPSFAARARGGDSLVARIDRIYLCPSSGGPGPFASCQDAIEGALIVHGPRGSVVSETPLRAITSYYPMAIDQPQRVDSNRDRIVALARAFAFWAPKQLGL